MKISALIGLMMVLSFFIQAQESSSEILNKAFEKARLDDKNVFVMFHASWCGWCKRMDNYMNDESCKAFFDKSYVIEHLVVKETAQNKHLENPGAIELLTKYKGENSGIPFFLIFDKNGNFLEDSFDASNQNLGCPASKEEVDEFVRILKGTSKLTDQELDVIYNTFVKK